MAKLLDENSELERRLSVIVATATGEQEYVAADMESMEYEKEVHAREDNPTDHCSKTEDVCFDPLRSPKKKKADGTFARPRGRPPSGMTWDPVQGLYVATVYSQDNNERVPATKNDLRTEDEICLPKKKAGRPKKTVGRPKKKKSGRTFARPVGRPPSGMAWDPVRGLYVAKVCSQDNNEKTLASKDDRRTEDGLRSSKKKTD